MSAGSSGVSFSDAVLGEQSNAASSRSESEREDGLRTLVSVESNEKPFVGRHGGRST